MGLWCIDCEGGRVNETTLICEKCGSSNIANVSGNMTIGDILLITKIYNNKNFLESMCKLHDTDIIEYTSRMNQFKQQLNSSSNQIKCPKCGSTNIQMVQRKWSLLTGFMTNKVDRVCVNCKYKF